MSKSSVVMYIILIWLFVQSAIIEPDDFQVTHYSIQEPLLQNIRVVFLSDFHFKKRDYKKLKKISKLVAAQNADLILLGGDYTSAKNTRGVMNMYIFTSKIKQPAKARMVAVLGEADWKAGGEQIKAALKKNGVIVLDNSNARLYIKKRYVDIIGLDDRKGAPAKYATTTNMNQAFRRTMKPRIVLTHHPDVYYDIMDEVSVILAGHTHGGQFILPFSPPLFVASKFGVDFASGLISKAQNKMIISKGLGESILPVRLNCKPEIVVVDFVK